MKVALLRTRIHILFVVALFAPWLAVADAPAKPPKAAIASAHQLASEAGMEILKQGGNAFDAAVAVSAALAVVEPSSSGLGGGGFWLLHRASDKFETMVDAREVAPKAATRDMFLDEKGNVVPGRSTATALAAGIPGEAAGWAHMATKYGRLPLKTSLQPAIRLAREGFPLNTRLRGGIEAKRNLFQAGAAAKIFLVKGEVPAVGTVIKQPELAQTLTALAENGPDGFYKGPVAKRMVDGVRKLGGIWSLEDFADYRVIERKPLYGEYRGARIVSAPPPSSGGVAIIDALNILAGFDLGTVDSATRKHLIVEAMRRSHRDRAEYLGDPDFVTVPTERLVHPVLCRRTTRVDPHGSRHAQRHAAGITKRRARVRRPRTSRIIDAEGNRVAGTQSINFFFGSGLMVPGTGVMLNNEMDDFAAKPGVPNGFRLRRRRRERHRARQAPAVEHDADVHREAGRLMILGTPGGS